LPAASWAVKLAIILPGLFLLAVCLRYIDILLILRLFSVYI
jgi:hypothetical protein